MKQKKPSINFKKIINRLVLFISVGVLLHIIFLLLTTDKEILYEVRKIRFRYLLAIAGLVMVPWLGHATRMVIWSRFLQAPLSFKEAMKIAVSTDLGAALTPTLIGGGPIKLGMLLNHKIPPPKASIMIALGAFEDLCFYISGIMLAFFFDHDSILKIMYSIKNLLIENIEFTIGIIILLTGYILLRKAGIITFKLSLLNVFPHQFRRKILRMILGIRNSFRETRNIVLLILKKGKLTFLLSFTILFMQWFAKFSILAILLVALGIDVSYIHIYLKQWLVWLTMIFIPTPGATGGAEASFYLLFGSSIPREVLALIVSTWRFFTYYFIMLSAVIIYQLTTYLTYRGQKEG